MSEGAAAAAAAAPGTYVKLVSAEGHEFIVDRAAAMVSGTIRAMLSSEGEFVESDGEIRLTEITTPVLEKVIEYFYYKLRYDNAQEIPEFPIDKDIAIPLLVAANFLNA